jgi:predicted nucleic-acid-binding protein
VIALDTNVLVRFIVEDDPAQSAAAAAVVDRAIEREEPLFITQIVLCELVWVLAHAYRFSRVEIVAVLQQLRRAAQVSVEGPDEVRAAIETYASDRGDFADYLIAERSVAAGCTTIVTFDRLLHADSRFAAPDHV